HHGVSARRGIRGDKAPADIPNTFRAYCAASANLHHPSSLLIEHPHGKPIGTERLRCLDISAVDVCREGHAPAAHHRNLYQSRLPNLRHDRVVASHPLPEPGVAPAEHSSTYRNRQNPRITDHLIQSDGAVSAQTLPTRPDESNHVTLEMETRSSCIW